MVHKLLIAVFQLLKENVERWWRGAMFMYSSQMPCFTKEKMHWNTQGAVIMEALQHPHLSKKRVTISGELHVHVLITNALLY